MEALHPVDMKIGRNLAKIRIRQNISATYLGSALSKPVSYQQIRKYERGTNRISAATLFEFCIILNCRMAEFFVGVENMIKTTEILNPYNPPAIEPYVLEIENLPTEQKKVFYNWAAELYISLSKHLTRLKDINHAI